MWPRVRSAKAAARHFFAVPRTDTTSPKTSATSRCAPPVASSLRTPSPSSSLPARGQRRAETVNRRVDLGVRAPGARAERVAEAPQRRRTARPRRRRRCRACGGTSGTATAPPRWHRASSSTAAPRRDPRAPRSRRRIDRCGPERGRVRRRPRGRRRWRWRRDRAPGRHGRSRGGAGSIGLQAGAAGGGGGADLSLSRWLPRPAPRAAAGGRVPRRRLLPPHAGAVGAAVGAAHGAAGGGSATGGGATGGRGGAGRRGAWRATAAAWRAARPRGREASPALEAPEDVGRRVANVSEVGPVANLRARSRCVGSSRARSSLTQLRDRSTARP